MSAHRETPGLGDYIEEERSDWIYGFDGKSLDNPPLERWAVKKDGGAFDQLTGATITPRAIVKAVRKTLIYFRDIATPCTRPGNRPPPGVARSGSGKSRPDPRQ